VNKILKNIMATGLQNLKKNSWGEIKWMIQKQ
jgi:hypothetical protein